MMFNTIWVIVVRSIFYAIFGWALALAVWPWSGKLAMQFVVRFGLAWFLWTFGPVIAAIGILWQGPVAWWRVFSAGLPGIEEAFR